MPARKAEAGKVVVRTTMRPDIDLEVDEREALDLRQQGLLIEDEKPASAPAARSDK